MDETFGYVAPVIPRRAVHPLALRAGVAAMVVVALFGALGVFVTSQERAADERRAALAATIAAQDAATAEQVAHDAAAMATDDVVEHSARAAAEDALAVALTELSLADAGPATLARHLDGLTFVDGLSTSPNVVSVAATDDAWAVAVMGMGSCVWLRLDASGAVSRDRGGVCTGNAALGATNGEW
jgi:hypothetical protein